MKIRIYFFVAFLFTNFTWAGPPRDDVMPMAGRPGKVRLGIAITPAHFPKHTPQDLDAAYKRAAQLGRNAVFISQWSRLKMNVVKVIVDKSRANGLVSVIGLSPTLLTGGRKGLDVPDAVKRAAGGRVTFANPAVRKAFVDAAVKLAELKPQYLCLATEINLMALGNLREYLLFSQVYKEAYRAVKRVSPNTRVFVSFQWDVMHILDTKAPHRLNEHGKLIDLFRPALDLIALTTYPSPHYATPAGLPRDYYSSLFNHVDSSEPIMLMEIGWPTSGSGTESEQAAFIRRIPELFRGMRVEVIAWALLHDVNLAEFDANLNTTGLLRGNGKPKKGLAAFRALH